MSITTTKGRNGLECVRITHPDGSVAEVYLNGAQVTSWVPANGEERLFVGSAATFANGESVRGGIPVVFPQFADQGPLPAHGFARRSLWTLASAEDGESSRAAFRLDDDAASRALWPHHFHLLLTVTLDVSTLTVELAVENTDASAFEFTAALHTYLKVTDVRRAAVTGLSGCKYIDKTRDKRLFDDHSSELIVHEETDRVYLDAPPDLRLEDRAGQSSLRLESRGFRDAVVWNPWAEKGKTFSGMTGDDYLRMICIEAAQVGAPVSLGPGQVWKGSQSLIAIT